MRTSPSFVNLLTISLSIAIAVKSSSVEVLWAGNIFCYSLRQNFVRSNFDELRTVLYNSRTSWHLFDCGFVGGRNCFIVVLQVRNTLKIRLRIGEYGIWLKKVAAVSSQFVLSASWKASLSTISTKPYCPEMAHCNVAGVQIMCFNWLTWRILSEAHDNWGHLIYSCHHMIV